VLGSGKNHRVEWWWRFSPGSAETYAVATIFLVIASLIRWALGLTSDDILPLPTYYPAVLFAALTLCADVRRFSQLNNADKVFGTHNGEFGVLDPSRKKRRPCS
jgi:hypothetical protein